MRAVHKETELFK